MTTDSEAMVDEFDTVAGWTVEAVRELGMDHAIPAACRGSGPPQLLERFADALDLRPGTRLLDVGSGLGGPAAWLRTQRSVDVIGVEPMADAATGSHRLFGATALIADAQALPFAGASFNAAWSLGVLCTITDKPAVLREVRRVLQPAGRCALLVYVADPAVAAPLPEGNSFPTRAELDALLADAHLRPLLVEDVDLSLAPDSWTDAAHAVDDLIAQRHRTDLRWQRADAQGAAMTAALTSGAVQPLALVVAVG